MIVKVIFPSLVGVHAASQESSRKEAALGLLADFLRMIHVMKSKEDMEQNEDLAALDIIKHQLLSAFRKTAEAKQSPNAQDIRGVTGLMMLRGLFSEEILQQNLAWLSSLATSDPASQEGIAVRYCALESLGQLSTHDLAAFEEVVISPSLRQISTLSVFANGGQAVNWSAFRQHLAITQITCNSIATLPIFFGAALDDIFGHFDAKSADISSMEAYRKHLLGTIATILLQLPESEANSLPCRSMLQQLMSRLNENCEAESDQVLFETKFHMNLILIISKLTAHQTPEYVITKLDL